MAKRTRNKATSPVVEQYKLTVLPFDRNIKEIEHWKRALLAAESITAPQRKTLYDLYRNVVLDTHVTSVLQKRTLAITNVTWMLHTADGSEVEAFASVLDSTFFEQLLTHAIESKFYGHSLMQLDWATQTVELVPRHHVNPADKLVLPNPYLYSTGIAYNEPPYTNMVLEVGQPDDFGLLLKVAPYSILKRNGVADWATFVEIFGMPMRVIYYDPSLPSNQVEAENAMKNMGGAGYIVLPDGSRVEFPSVGSQQGNDTYDRFADFCNAEISKAILGQTMTTEVGANGSRAQAEVHLTAENRIAQNDLKYVERVLNERLIPLLQAQGVVIPQGARFQPVEEEQAIDKETRLTMDLQIHQQVGRLPKAYFKEEYNVEFVDDSDEIEAVETEKPEAPAEKEAKKKKQESLTLPAQREGGFWEDLLNFFDQAPSR